MKRCSTPLTIRHMQIKNHNGIPIRIAIIKNIITSVGKNVEKLEPSYIVGDVVKWCSRFRKRLAIPENIKYGVTMWPRNSTPKYILRRNENISIQNRYMNIYGQKVETIQMPTNWWMDQTNVLLATQWNIIWPLKEMKYWYMIQHGWTLEILC